MGFDTSARGAAARRRLQLARLAAAAGPRAARGPCASRARRGIVIDMEAVSAFTGRPGVPPEVRLWRIVGIEGDKLDIEFDKAGSKKVVARPQGPFGSRYSAAAGHDVAGAATVAEARVTPACTRVWDVVVLDLHLGSPKAACRSRCSPPTANPDCRVIMITGSTLFARGEIFEMAPAVATVLRKPVPIDELLAFSP
jgi:hypothetical protein